MLKVKISKDIHGKEKDVEFIGVPVTYREGFMVGGSVIVLVVVGQIFNWLGLW